MTGIANYDRPAYNVSGGMGTIIGESPNMLSLFSAINKLAVVKSSVVIYGGTGTGKELVARALHYNSEARRKHNFIPVNCACLNPGLAESEMFGHIKGSFTGAYANRKGKFQAADKGTLFLDEISDMPLAVQAKLLKAVEEKEITPLGSSRPIPVDIRIVAATNKSLEREVEAGRFREDLYFRLSVVPVYVPRLSERADDIPGLAQYFIDLFRQELDAGTEGLTPGAEEKLREIEWPGNVRQLENVIQRALVRSGDKRILGPDQIMVWH